MQYLSRAKRQLLGEARWPGNGVYFGVMLVLGCIGMLPVLLALFTGEQDNSNLVTWVLISLYFFLSGIAEVLPVRWRGATVALRVAGLLLTLTIIVFVVADIAFG